MFSLWECCSSCCDNGDEEVFHEPETFSLPSPLPQWPKGKDFGSGKISLGEEIQVMKITKFDQIWRCRPILGKTNSVTFYKPTGIPAGYFSLGDYCQPSDQSIRGYVLVAKGLSTNESSPPLEKPENYRLIWCARIGHGNGSGYVWLPNPKKGYKPLGFVVTTEPDEPDVEQIRCVRSDLTESCESDEVVFSTNSPFSRWQFYVWNTRPRRRGMFCKGVPVGTFFCSTEKSVDDLSISCLKNVDSSFRAMPNLEQVHALVKHYGPTLYFHPDEDFMPSSVSWFFKSGALLYKEGKDKGLCIDSKGSNLPEGGSNDGEFWLDLPDEKGERDHLKSGSIDSAELYVHVKPSCGGTFTDIVMWIFCPFNGPCTIKIGGWNYTFSRIGQHVGDWEHYTLRISNFNGELWSMYFSEHSGGEWVDASELEFIDGNKAIVYASKSGHASFPHEGCYLQGSEKLGVGARNDCAKSDFFIDSSVKYEIIGAEYLGDDVVEPMWLQYMREWGPTITYDSRSEVDKIIERLPFFLRLSLESVMALFPTELYGEEGPTGPKEKDNWLGDERC